MPQEDKEDLRSLPPEERIRKLKELEKKRKKEIAEAQEKIRESEEEIKDRLKWLDKVPMPEFAKEDLEGLSEEARQVIKERKGIKEKKKEERREAGEKGEEEGIEEGETVRGGEKIKGREISLEETLARERAELPPGAREVEYGLHRASQRPMRDIYRELAGIREAAEERGYVTGEQARRAEYLAGAIEEKFHSAEEGRYADFTQEVAERGILSQEIAAKVRGLYRGQGEQYQR